MNNEPLTPFQIWSIPILLALISAVGLISALLGNGPWDMLSWGALSAPIAVTLCYTLPMFLKGRRPPRGA